ncbi:MAG: tetratricopeptide repeat protein [bacterium]
MEQTKDPALKAEAAVRAGNLAYALKKYKDAAAFFEKARGEDAPQFWKELAHLGLVQSRFALADYEAVAKVFDEVKPHFPAQARAQAFFLTAESYRLLKKNKEALNQYDSILKEFPKDAVAEPSAWARLLLLQETKSPLFLSETEAFPASFPQSPHLAFVEMMRADVFFKEGKFDVCAPMYEKLSGDKAVQSAEEAVRAAVLFRWGSSVFALRKFEAAERVWNDFLKQFPRHEQASDALWMLAQSYQALKKIDEARAALDKLLKENPSFKQRETALWQAALLAGDQKDNAAMKKRLEELLDKFPQTQWAADAHHWLAFCLSQEKRDDLAKQHWEKARLLDPKTYAGIVMQQLIRIALQEKNLVALTAEVEKYDQWLAERNKLPEKDNKPMPSISPDVIEWMAQEFAASADPSRAEKYYRRVLAQSADAAQQRRAQVGLGSLFSKLQKWADAAREWETFRSRFPKEADHNTALESLAEAYIHFERLDEAEKLANQVLRQSPEGEHNARGRMLLGEVAFARKKYDEAAKIFSAVALLIDDPVLTPQARIRAEDARKLAGQQGPRQPVPTQSGPANNLTPL